MEDPYRKRTMRIWIVTVGEPLPFPGAKDRLHRSGVLAGSLLDFGHEVVWWGSTFDHFTKTHHFSDDTILEPTDRFRMVLFRGIGYRRNVSLGRLRDHRQVGRKFAAAIEKEARKPDVILSSFPTIELAVEAVRYGRKHGIPVLLDVRDLWPDIFANVAPKPLRRLARMPLRPLFRQTEEAFEGCTGVVGISPGYLEWGLRYAGRAKHEGDALFPLGYRKLRRSGADLDRAGESLKRLGVDPAKAVCWFIGTFGRTYDLAPLIETARAFQEQGRTDVQFVVSGTGEDQRAYKALGAGLRNIVFTGWVDAAQIAYLMTVARIGIAAYAPGAPQGLPNKFFEYLSEGIPILSSLEGESADMLRQQRCGLSYRAGDGADLARRLGEMLADREELHAMARRGKQLFERELSADVIYPKLVGHLERIASLT